jgi:aminotransferase
MSVATVPNITKKQKPDIRAITRLVPPSGNLVQGQSELPISPALAQAAAEAIAKNKNHYCPAEGIAELRTAVAKKIATFNSITVDPAAPQLELLITNGGTGALIAVAQTYLRGGSILLFEPFYPYHRRIAEELGGTAEIMPLRGANLQFDPEELRTRCQALKRREKFPLKAIVVCSPANPTGKVNTKAELEAIAAVCQELDLLCICDEVYEHYVSGVTPHISIATLLGMWDRTITVNSFSKSWNISGWRLGYVYGKGSLIAPLNNASNVFYVNSATPLQHGLASVVMSSPDHYHQLTESFAKKRARVSSALQELGFRIYDSGSSFYIWARIPEAYQDAMVLNQQMMERAQVAAVPGAAFADGDEWDRYMRFCIAREDHILESALEKMRSALR